MVILKTEIISHQEIEKILQTMNQLIPVKTESGNELSLTPKDVTVQMFACGNLNCTYHVEIHQNHLKNFPTTSFVLKFFNSSSELPFDRHCSQIAHLIIGQSGLGPTVYLLTPNSIVMESFATKGRIANLLDDQDPNFRRALAGTLARLHTLPVQIGRNRALEYLESTLNGSSWNSEETLANLTSGWMRDVLLKFSDTCTHLLDVKVFKTEVKWFVELMRKEEENFGIVFSHNDFNHSNILILEEDDDDEDDEVKKKISKNYNIKLIDFDFSNYFYRGADLGRYFLDYTDPNVEDTPTSPDASSVTEKVMLEYIEYYRQECATILTETGSQNTAYLKDPQNSAQNILREAKIFMLYCSLLNVFQATWAAGLARKKDDGTMEGCLIWADMCFGKYQRLKKAYIDDGFLTHNLEAEKLKNKLKEKVEPKSTLIKHSQQKTLKLSLQNSISNNTSVCIL